MVYQYEMPPGSKQTAAVRKDIHSQRITKYKGLVADNVNPEQNQVVLDALEKAVPIVANSLFEAIQAYKKKSSEEPVE